MSQMQVSKLIVRTPIAIENIPQMLKDRQQWLCWRLEADKSGKLAKVPYRPDGSRRKASVSDPSTWGTFAQALACFKRNDWAMGIGVTLTRGLVGVDLDGFPQPRELPDWAAGYVKLLDTYTEWSPSRQGVHALAFGKLPPVRRKTGPTAPHGIEMYDCRRYFTVTGDVLTGYTTIQERCAELAEMHAEVFGRGKALGPYTADARAVGSSVCLSDGAVLELAHKAENSAKFSRLWAGDASEYGRADGTPNHSAADLALCNLLAFYTQDGAQIDRLFRRSGLLRPKWDTRHAADGRTYGKMTIDCALVSVTDVYTPAGSRPSHGAGGECPRLDAEAAELLAQFKGLPSGPERDPVLDRLLDCMARMTSSARERWRGLLIKHGLRAPFIDSALRQRDGGLDSPSGLPSDDELRDRFLAEHPDLAFGLGDWRRYAQGLWPVIDENLVRTWIVDVLEAAKAEGIKPDAQRLHSVFTLAKIKCSVPDAMWDADADVLVCANGTLHIPTVTLREHSPHDFSTSGVPYAYDADATAPVFERALATTVPAAADFLQEFAGYALTTDTSLEIAVWLWGPPGSGKSTLLTGLQTMLGSRAGLLGLADIERSRFALANLPGKTLVVATEQPSQYIASTHILNTIISGEPLTVDRKFRDPIVVTPRCKIAWAMNELPRVSNASNGLFRRVKVIRFPVLSDPDPNVKEDIRSEGAGILNWALRGLARLRQRGAFDIPEHVADATREFHETNDKALLFVKECCARGPDCREQSSALYRAYRDWCHENGLMPESNVKMAEQWRRLGFQRRRSQWPYLVAGRSVAHETARMMTQRCSVGMAGCPI